MVIEEVIITMTTNEPLTDHEQQVVLDAYCDNVESTSNIDVECVIEEVTARRRLLSEVYNYLLSAWATDVEQSTMTEVSADFADEIETILAEELPDVNITVELTPDAQVTSPEATGDTDVDDDSTEESSGMSGGLIAAIVIICCAVSFGILLCFCCGGKDDTDNGVESVGLTQTQRSGSKGGSKNVYGAAATDEPDTHDGLVIEDVH